METGKGAGILPLKVKKEGDDGGCYHPSDFIIPLFLKKTQNIYKSFIIPTN